MGLPIAFVLGWLASRLDLRQLRIENRQAPKAYFRGLNFLLNEQQDQAIDAFIEAVQNDPDTSELHFALGNLFRRRGEYERAVRVHEHLLSRGDLSRADRHRAQHALALDFLKAGLLDRAEEALRKLEGTRLRRPGAAGPAGHLRALARLGAGRRDRRASWRTPARAASAGRLAHYLCEQAARAPRRRGRAACCDQAIRTRARRAARPRIELAALQRTAGDAAGAFDAAGQLAEAAPAAMPLLARPLAECAAGLRPAGRGAASCCRPATSRRPRWTCWKPSSPLEPDAEPARGWYVRHLRARAVAGGRRQVAGRREAGARAVPPRRCSARWTTPSSRSPATAAPPAASRPSSISGSAPAARPGTATRRAGWKNYEHMNLPRKQQLAKARVLVVGDAMLDRYWHGAVDRISPEAPVPVVKVTREEERIGAAANVAYNVVTLGAQASFLGVVGDDEPGHRLEALLRETGIRTAPQARRRACSTTVKLRVIGRQQQLLRMDFENEPDHEVLALQTEAFAAAAARSTTPCCSPTTARAGWRTSRPMIAARPRRGQAGAGRPQGPRLLALPRRHA